MKIIQRLIKETSGATAIEYGLIAGGISLAIVAAVITMGDQLRAYMETITAVLAGALASFLGT